MLNKILFCPLDIDVDLLEISPIVGTPVITKYNPYWDSTLITNTAKYSYIDNVLKQLPFSEITNIQYKIQKIKVGEHIDVHSSMVFSDGEYEHILATEPAGVRIVVSGKTDSLEVFNGTSWVTAHVPKVPCAYILNSTSALHRVKEDQDRTTIYVRGWLDKSKHTALLEQSYAKYKNFAIVG